MLWPDCNLDMLVVMLREVSEEIVRSRLFVLRSQLFHKDVRIERSLVIKLLFVK